MNLRRSFDRFLSNLLCGLILVVAAVLAFPIFFAVAAIALIAVAMLVLVLVFKTKAQTIKPDPPIPRG